MSTGPYGNIREASQSLTPGELVEMFSIDLSPLGVNTIFNFTPVRSGSRPVTFRGITYQPIDVKADGFEYSGNGTLPQPQISITNVTRIMSSAAIIYGDLLGARLLRLRTFSQFLDDGSKPDPNAAYAPDIYRFNQKLQHNKRLITWSLAAAMDQEGVQLPRRQVLRDVCLWKYRRVIKNPDGSFGGYDYTGVQCPYAGAQAYDAQGNPVAPAQDVPGRHVNNCCKVRFGAASQLPFGGFPGVGRIAI